MSDEPEVDSYFLDALNSGDPHVMEQAIREYLGMYIKPSTIEKLIVVPDKFFSKDDRDDVFRYISTYQDDNSTPQMWELLS